MAVTVDDKDVQWIENKSEALRIFFRESRGIPWNGTHNIYWMLDAQARQGERILVIGSGTNKKAITRASHLAVAVATALEGKNLRFYEGTPEFYSFCNHALHSKKEHPAYCNPGDVQAVGMSTSRFGMQVVAIGKYTAETKEHYLSIEVNDRVLVLSHTTHVGFPENQYRLYLYGACGIRHGWFPTSVVNLGDY